MKNRIKAKTKKSKPDQRTLEAQRTALAHPCRSAEEMSDQRYRGLWVLKEGVNLFVSMILTVDADEDTLKVLGNPVWHASVAFLIESGPMEIHDWTSTQFQLADSVI